MWRLVHPLTSVLFEPNEFSFRGVEDTVSNQGFTRGDIDNQSFNSSAELLCCVRAVYIWTVDFFFFFGSFAFRLQKVLSRDKTRR